MESVAQGAIGAAYVTYPSTSLNYIKKRHEKKKPWTEHMSHFTHEILNSREKIVTMHIDDKIEKTHKTLKQCSQGSLMIMIFLKKNQKSSMNIYCISLAIYILASYIRIIFI